MSIREAAARAGVSPATVSRVFTQPRAVAAGTRRRVMTAAEELQYAPHPAASSLARGRTGDLGIVVPDIANSFSATITKAVHRQARREGSALVVASADVLDKAVGVRATVITVVPKARSRGPRGRDRPASRPRVAPAGRTTRASRIDRGG
jgi:DNA-binding LacI/PurR family transcriptional regulator